MIMNCKLFVSLIAALFFTTGLFAQLGIKAGVNVANEINSFSQSDMKAGFNSANLTGYQIGLVYQAMPKKSGLGIEVGALLTQKGSSFSDSTSIENVIKQGYKELNYLEVPLNLRYHFVLGFIGVYGFGGLYGGYALSGKTVDETTNSTQNTTFTTLKDHLDYGYNVGAGVELFKKIQFGATLSQGLKNTSTAIVGLPTPTTTTNHVYSVNLVYLF
ncbi:MAG: outer membrane beta-barrel protein [Paludibacter sp.]|nr:outer membrane beta-barrel protein [Paludibacter sp.]